MGFFVRHRPRAHLHHEGIDLFGHAVRAGQRHVGLRHIVVGDRHARRASRLGNMVGPADRRCAYRGMGFVAVVVVGLQRQPSRGVTCCELDVLVPTRSEEHVSRVLDAHGRSQGPVIRTVSGQLEVYVRPLVHVRIDRRDGHRGEGVVRDGLVRERSRRETDLVADAARRGKGVADARLLSGLHCGRQGHVHEFPADADIAHRAARAFNADAEGGGRGHGGFVEGLAVPKGQFGTVHERFGKGWSQRVHPVSRLHGEAVVSENRIRTLPVLDAPAVQVETAGRDAHAVRVVVSRDHTVREHQLRRAGSADVAGVSLCAPEQRGDRRADGERQLRSPGHRDDVAECGRHLQRVPANIDGIGSGIRGDRQAGDPHTHRVIVVGELDRDGRGASPRDGNRERVPETERQALAVVVHAVVGRGHGHVLYSIHVAEGHARRNRIVRGVRTSRGDGLQGDRHRASRDLVQANLHCGRRAALCRDVLRLVEIDGHRNCGLDPHQCPVRRRVAGGGGARRRHSARVDGRDGQPESKDGFLLDRRSRQTRRCRRGPVERNHDAAGIGLSPGIGHASPPGIAPAAPLERDFPVRRNEEGRPRLGDGTEWESRVGGKPQIVQPRQPGEDVGGQRLQLVVVQPEGIQAGEGVEYHLREGGQSIVCEVQREQSGETDKIVRGERRDVEPEEGQRRDLPELCFGDLCTIRDPRYRRDNRVADLFRSVADAIFLGQGLNWHRENQTERYPEGEPRTRPG